ncbi:MAG: hypothetical protein EA415_07485 [Sphaerobacteraceae bacterium]|nr:MAG: hypothetical protein EA415_07485 [Sphaerobacteraceae bacterium]
MSFSMVLVLLTGLVGTASAAKPISSSGEFTAAIDESSFSFTPVGANCQLVVSGKVTFSGTLQGTGDAVTTALVFAPCSEVGTTPPGTFRDVFSSDIEFKGTLEGTPVTAGIRYHGTVAPGGDINAVMNFSGGLRGSVKVDGEVAVGGVYNGKIVLK